MYSSLDGARGSWTFGSLEGGRGNRPSGHLLDQHLGFSYEANLSQEPS